MKKLIYLTFAFFILTASQSFAQLNYKTAVGLGIDFGDGSTFVGPTIKHFFNTNNAVQGEVLFGDNLTTITGLYQYHGDFKGAAGLKWYLGVGPSFFLYDGGSDIALRPVAGLDYKINGAPLALNFDWRPALIFYENDSQFEAARFGIGFKYTF